MGPESAKRRDDAIDESSLAVEARRQSILASASPDPEAEAWASALCDRGWEN
jgi:hypothetical protein